MSAKRVGWSALAAASLWMLALLSRGVGQEGGEKPDAGSAAPDTAVSAEEKAIRQSADAFIQAFNAGDAKRAAHQFLEKAEYLSADGEVITGREAIQDDLAAFFKEFPKAHLEMQIDSVRLVGPRVAIEEGQTVVTREPDGAPNVQSYVAVDVLTEEGWKIASVREFSEETPLTPHDRLQPLAWLVGEWMDESDEGVVMTTCRWSEDGNFLLQDFHLQVAGRKAVSGQQRIGWDPLTGHVKSWVFDSHGGYSEGLWSWDGERWIVKAHGVRPDGSVASATNLYTPRSPDSYLFESTHRLVGESPEPDARVVVVRRPPPPAAKDESGATNKKPAATRSPK